MSASDRFKELTATENYYVDWLATPEFAKEIKTELEIADKLEVSARTLRRWKKRPEIISAVMERKKELATIDGFTRVIDRMIIRASYVEGPEAKMANEAARDFLKWFLGESMGEGTTFHQTTKVSQSQSETTFKDMSEERRLAILKAYNGEFDSNNQDGNGRL